MDAGDESIYPDTAPNTDQIGQPRILDGNSDANRVIDIGARERFINRPVASFTLSGNPVGVNELVELDGTSSNHTNAAFDIVLWEWDFDFDGTNFDVDATGEVVTNRFSQAGEFTIALRVTDDSSPPQTDIEVRTIIVGVAPELPRVTRPFSVTSDSTPTIVWEGGGAEFDVQVLSLIHI